MFKKTERLNTREFTQFFAIGKRRHSSHFTFILSPFPTRKVAVVVGKKVAKSAATRNLIKRRVSAFLRGYLEQEQYQGVVIVLVKPTYVTLSRKLAATELHHAIAQVLKSA